MNFFFRSLFDLATSVLPAPSTVDVLYRSVKLATVLLRTFAWLDTSTLDVTPRQILAHEFVGRPDVRSLLSLLLSLLVRLATLADALQDLLPVLVGLQLGDNNFAGCDTKGY